MHYLQEIISSTCLSLVVREVIVEEHLADFYAYAHNLNIEHEDVWMTVVVQSLEGDVRKWFRSLIVGSITGIETLDETFLSK